MPHDPIGTHSEHIEVLAFTIPLCTSGDCIPLSLGSSLDDHEIVDQGWISVDNGPQELLLDLLHTSTLHDITVLAHETWIPGQITILSSTTNRVLCCVKFATLEERGGNPTIREQISLTFDPPQSHSSLRLIVEGGLRQRQGIVSISIRGVRDDIDPTQSHRHHFHGSKNQIDTELHTLGLESMSEAHIHQGGTAGANEILSKLDEASDSSTGVILDMLRQKKHDLIRSRSSTAAMNDDEANRLSHVFSSFDRVGKAIARAAHVKKRAVDADQYGLAASAADKLNECYDARDFLAKREALRTWACGGDDSNVFENSVLSMVQSGWHDSNSSGGGRKGGSSGNTALLNRISPWIKAMRAAPLFTLPYSLRQVSSAQDEKVKNTQQELLLLKQERELEDEEEKRIQAEEELEQSQGMDLTYEKWVKNLLQFHFGSEGVLFAQGIKKPSELTNGMPELEVPFLHVFGTYLTQCIMDRKTWVLRQAACAVLQCCIDDETGWLKKHLNRKSLKPIEFLNISLRLLIHQAKDSVLAVFRQVVDTTASLLSILWTDEAEQCRLSTPLLDVFVHRIIHAPTGESGKGLAVRNTATDGLLFLAKECDYIGPVKVAYTLYRAMHNLHKRSLASTYEHLMKPFMVLIDTFGCRKDYTLPPEDQLLSVDKIIHNVCIELIANRHKECKALGLKIALVIYEIDVSYGGQASRDAMGINENGDGASYPLFRSVSFVQQMVEIDKKLLRKIRESDTRVIEKRGVNDEEEDENVKALKRQLAEMKQLMKKNATESPGKTKTTGRKKKIIKKTKPHPPLLEEKNHVVQQSIQRSAFDDPTKKVDSKLVEEKKNKKTENNVEEKEKEKEKAAQQLEKKDAENNAEEKEKEKAAQQLEKMEAKSTTPIKLKPESKELIAKKMVIMKKIRNLKLSLLSIEDETDKIPVKKKINLLTTKLTNLTEEDVINDTKEDAEEGKLNETKPAQDNKAQVPVQQEKKTSLNRVKTAAKVVATTTKKKDDKCSVM